MGRTFVCRLLLFVWEVCLVCRIEGIMQYISDNSSERPDLFKGYTTHEERWADAAFTYISTLDCTDATDAFFTTKRECKELISIDRSRMSIHIASPSIFGTRYKAYIPDEPLTRSVSHDAVVVVDPYPEANFGHLVIVFYVDLNLNHHQCLQKGGFYVGFRHCMTLALRKRCKNALERRSKRRNFARRCEINFLPVVRTDKHAMPSELYPTTRENHLKCRPRLAGYGPCAELRTVAETSELICNPIRDNTQRCSTTHETVHTSCRMFEICDQAVLLSGGWNRQTTGTRHLRNLELFYWMLRENGFKKRNIKIFFANGARGVKVPGDHPHQVLPSAMKLALRYHLQAMCRTAHCVDSLVIYMNSPTKTDGTSLLWDVDGNGMAVIRRTYVALPASSKWIFDDSFQAQENLTVTSAVVDEVLKEYGDMFDRDEIRAGCKVFWRSLRDRQRRIDKGTNDKHVTRVKRNYRINYVEEGEQYTLSELKSDLADCQARKIHMVVDQSYAGEIAQAFKNSDEHKNVIVFASGKSHEYSFNDDYTIHWVNANHKRDCSRQVHEHSTNAVQSSSPIMREGNQGRIKTTIFGAPCDVTPEFSDRELRENYLGCQNLSTAEWLRHLFNRW